MIVRIVFERLQDARIRYSLADLMAIVLVAGLAFGLAHDAHVDFANGLFTNRSLGLVTMTLAIAILVPLFRQAFAKCSSGGGAKSKVWPVAWRLVVAVGLAFLAVEQAMILRLPATGPLFPPMQFPPKSSLPYEARLGVLPILTAFGLVGATCCLLTRHAKEKPDRARFSLRWLIPPLVATVGLMIAMHQSMVPYLVVVAVDAVTLAMTSRSGQTLPDVFMRDAPKLTVRLASVGQDVLLACVVLVGAGIFVTHDLRRDLSEQALSWRGLIARVLTLAATFYIGLRLIFVAVPMVHPCFYEGLFHTIEPRDVTAMVIAFGLCGFGLAARAVASRRPSLPRPRWRRWLLGSVGSLVVPIVVCYTSANYLYLNQLDSFDQLLSGSSISELESPTSKWAVFYSTLIAMYPAVETVMGFLLIDRLCWSAVLLWLIAMVLLVNLRKQELFFAPLDEVAMNRTRFCWFIWCAFEVTAICLAALPALALGGVVLTHFRFTTDVIYGWKMP